MVLINKEILGMVFDNIYNGIYITDKNGITVAVNKAFEEMSGITNAEVAGKSMYDLIHKDHYFSGSASILVLEKKIPMTITYSTSTNKKLLVKGKPVFDENNEISYIINTVWDLTDISYKKEIDSDTARELMLVKEEMVSSSPQMMQTIDLGLKVANTKTTILITGESGVGKSLLASLIHKSGDIKDSPFVKLNCATIPENLIESELFGYESGAFTGANRKGKKGLFTVADGGTIFLDEISELPLYTQSKLLGVIQDKEFMPLGANKTCRVDVRIIAATNRSLWEMVKNGTFREDLYYRLNVVPINIPPLRKRPEDIAPLTNLFLESINKKHRTYKTFSHNLVHQLEQLQWQGNIRELENMVERLVVTSYDEEIRSAYLREIMPNIENVYSGAGNSADFSCKEMGVKDMLDSYEKEILEVSYNKCHSTREMARDLKISQASIVRKLQKYSIEHDC